MFAEIEKRSKEKVCTVNFKRERRKLKLNEKERLTRILAKK